MEKQEIINEYEAAMFAANESGYAGMTAEQVIRNLVERAEAAEAKLAALANKKPDIMVSSEGAEAIRAIMNREMSAAGRYVTLKRPSGIGEEGMMGVYTRPAPAADLADLLPDVEKWRSPEAVRAQMAYRAAILSKIEEAK